ncbi:hypothetical protein EIN_497930 [Entamoeba invadens IP1]|uniref:Uncharacterized protein n=1 Tax=Entamoeba invadens IP1 TaxID=370355 RepID=A0A0A1UH38_ENTIV|nr:hypothetical protein EIN_497930 [Entamoeba invadens IP1]ELP94613.1 hypothetical protein EIN_497930 [Entamoeba invadens IP1]|eukprot:XP_004261384.1 hypothetical protein EIN_497930 [Entamoeba invadens IP1]
MATEGPMKTCDDDTKLLGELSTVWKRLDNLELEQETLLLQVDREARLLFCVKTELENFVEKKKNEDRLIRDAVPIPVVKKNEETKTKEKQIESPPPKEHPWV